MFMLFLMNINGYQSCSKKLHNQSTLTVVHILYFTYSGATWKLCVWQTKIEVIIL